MADAPDLVHRLGRRPAAGRGRPVSFDPARWLPGPNAQTVFANLWRPPTGLRPRRERWELPDGDFLDVDRHGDPALLTEHFVAKLSARFGEPVKPLEPATLAWFDRYAWPGNIRELENLICRHFLLAENGVIAIEPPGDAAQRAASSSDPLALAFADARAMVLERFERQYLSSVLTRAKGNVTLAASLAGKERRALGKMLKKHSLGRARPATG